MAGDSEKLSIYQFYFSQQESYAKIYGEKTIVFIQIGKFYEAYNDKTKGYLQLEELEPLLNIKFIRRDKKAGNKPNQFGINCVSMASKLGTLIEHGYTVVLFDQKEPVGKEIERECIGVYSPGTYLSDKQMSDANYLMTIYLREEKQMKSAKILMAVGITLVDITIGRIIIHEFYSSILDEKFGLDEIYRMFQMFGPVETVIYYHPLAPNENTTKNIKSYLELEKIKNCYFYEYVASGENDKLGLLTDSTFGINYQNDYLSKIFNLSSQLSLKGKVSAIEILNLERKPYAIISLMIGLKYIAGHNLLLVRNLRMPEIYLHNKYLILGNNAVEQLNIVDSNKLESYNRKIESVFDVVNKTSTPMGKRYLKENLLAPMSQENKQCILTRYDCIEALCHNDLYEKIHAELKNIYDMERLHRRMALGIIAPYEFYRLDLYYQSTTKIISLVKKIPILRDLLPEEIVKTFLSYQLKYNKEYDFDSLQNYSNSSDVENSFFKKGLHLTIDKIQDKIDYVRSLINSSSQCFIDLILAKYPNKNPKDLLTLESNEREGYYYTINKTNEKILREEIDRKKEIRIDLTIGETIVVKKNDIVFKPLLKGRTKIFVTPLVEHTINLTDQTKKLSKLVKREFSRGMVGYYIEYMLMMHAVTKFVSEIDFLVGGAIVSKNYFYCKPVVPSKENAESYFRATGLRHAIIEQLCVETEYIPLDVELGNVPGSKDKNGILLFGLNSAGKSSCMKSIGIAIILAQIGYYVPAQTFEYEPYMALYARITGNDNIFKGLSSFALEMAELDAILTRTQDQGPSTLIIGDEVCRGTEMISGVAIVASTLINLSLCNCSFIFSSHLHDIPSIEEIKQLKNLRLYHIRTEYDEQNQCLVFDRKLVEGPGPSVYGLMVARFLIKNNSFINTAETIKKKLINEEQIEIPHKKSNYNKLLLVNNCNICGYFPQMKHNKELESHHIHFQKDCLSDGKIKIKPHLTKNKLYNLVILCRECHLKVHKGEIIINGYLDTSYGPILDYRTDIKKKMTEAMNKLQLLKGLRS